MWTMVWWYWLELTPNLSTRALWQPPVLSGGPLSRDISGASRIMGKGNENLVYSSPRDFKRSLTCRKILRHGTSGFTSHSKEGVLRIFVTFKNPSPRPVLNPRSLGPVASTLTTTPSRRLLLVVIKTQADARSYYFSTELQWEGLCAVNVQQLLRRSYAAYSRITILQALFLYSLRFEILTAATSCRFVGWYQHFWGTFCHNLQGSIPSSWMLMNY
jgi:hypothetical protein